MSGRTSSQALLSYTHHSFRNTWRMGIDENL